MKSTVLPALKRERAGKGAARAVRNEGLVPGVIYGDKKEPTLISMNPRVILAEMARPGFWTHQFEIEIDGKKTLTMCQDLQVHVVTDKPVHIDFLRIRKDSIVTVEIPVKFENESVSPGLKRGGVLNIVRNAVEVVCKANEIPEHLVADLSGLQIGDSMHISAVALPKGVTPTITDRDFTIATVVAPSGLKSDDNSASEEAEEVVTE